MKKIIFTLITLGLLSSSLLAKNVETLLEENKCMSCHDIMGMKSAPPFWGIVRMNSNWFGTSKSSIINSIKNGSQGKYPMFSNTKMPSFKNLSEKELNTLADWIISQRSSGMHRNKMHNGHMGNGHMNNRHMK